jgi:hypothetical protein
MSDGLPYTVARMKSIAGIKVKRYQAYGSRNADIPFLNREVKFLATGNRTGRVRGIATLMMGRASGSGSEYLVVVAQAILAWSICQCA